MQRIAALAILFFSACSGKVDKTALERAFNEIQPRETTAAEVASKMGPPARREVMNVAGAEITELSWRDETSIYSVVIAGADFVGAEPRVVSKHMTPIPT